MMKFYVCVLLLLNSGSIYAQQPAEWHSAADKYLRTLLEGDGAFETPDNLEALRQVLATEFKKGKLDAALVHWLAVWSVRDNAENAKQYYEEVLKRYERNAYHRALFIMDYCRLDFLGEDHAEKIKTALSAFEEAQKDSSLIYLYALTDYADALIDSKKYAEGLQQLDKARALGEATVGMKSGIYSNILSSISNYYNSIGNQENAVKYKEMSDRVVADHLGANQLYRTVFDEPLPYFMASHKNSSVAGTWRIAALFQYPPTEMYNSNLFIYQKAFAADKYEDVVKGFSTLAGEEQNYASALFSKGVLDLEVNNTSSSEWLVKAFAFYSKMGSDKKDLTNFFNCANYLACAYVQNNNYSAALRIFDEVEKHLSTLRLQGYKWYDKIHHNMILTHELAGHRVKVISLMEPYYGTGSYSIEYDFKERYTKYGDMLFGYGEYKKAQVVYSRAHTEYWGEAERKNEGREKLMDENGNEIETVDAGNSVLNISATGSGFDIHSFKPTGDAYTRLLYKLAQTAFLNDEFTDARKYTLDYINEFYTKIEWAHINYERGADLYEIYRLKRELFPAYDLLQNIIMMDTTSLKEFIADNNARAYMQILDSKANIQYEYRHMRNVIENGNDEALKQVLAKYNSQRNRLAQLRLAGDGSAQEIEDLKISVDTLKAYMSGKTASALFDRPSEKFVYWTDVKSTLKRNEAAIEIRRFPKYDSGRFTSEIIYAAYVITPISAYPEVVFLKNGNHLEGRGLRQYQNSVRLKLEDRVSYNDYWKPVQQLLNGIWKVYLSSDGVYTQINVNTLLNPESKKYLLEELTVYNVISTKALKDIKDLTGSVKEATLMGRPAYYMDDPKELKEKNPFGDDLQRAITRTQIASGNIVDLPGTEKEIQDIAKILKGKGVDTKYFVGKNSTEEAFKQSSGDILHIATHGFWFKENNMLENADAMFNSGLLLAGVKNYYEHQKSPAREDGILTAYEVQGMNLDNTQLVVLSACETAVGHVEAGEGVYGLQRAFNIAGADKLIMSLWKVDDMATQQLFAAFYKNWVNGSATMLEAFQQAQHSLREKYKHPYYWGAFVIVD